METKDIKCIFYAVGKMDLDKKSVVDQDGRKHTLTLKEVLCWEVLKQYPMDEEEFICTYMRDIRIRKFGIYMDKNEAVRVLERMLQRGVVIMGEGKEEGEEVEDLLGQIRLKENTNFKKVVKSMLLTLSFFLLIDAYRMKKTKEAKILIELYNKGYLMHDIMENLSLTEGVFSEETREEIPIVTYTLLISQILVEDGCCEKK